MHTYFYAYLYTPTYNENIAVRNVKLLATHRFSI